MSTFELISDLHKDARGFRPSSSFMEAFEATPFAEQEATWNALCDELAEREEDERFYQLDSQKVFETRLAGMMEDYGISHSNAMRWDADSFDVDINYALQHYGDVTQELEHYLWKQGIAHNLFPSYVEELKTEMGL